MHKMLLTDVVTATAITITLLISSDEFCFAAIFLQFFVVKVAFLQAFFADNFIDVAGAFIDVDLFGVSVAATNLIIGS